MKMDFWNNINIVFAYIYIIPIGEGGLLRLSVYSSIFLFNSG